MSDAAKRAREQDARLSRLYDVDAKLAEIPELLDAAWAEWRELGVLSEDGVWNEMGEFYETMKAIEQAASRIVTQYEGRDQ